MHQPKTIAFATLGCKLNFSETSTLSRLFIEKGYTVVDFKQVANVYVINSCTVTKNAEKKCEAVIKQAVKKNSIAIVAVVGCFSQLRSEKIANITGVNIVLGTSEKFRLHEVIDEYCKNKKTYIETSKVVSDKIFIPSYSINERTRSFFKIQDGCDYHCAYCTVPLARGSSRSGTIDATLSIAKQIAFTNVKEIILTGVNVGDFGKNNGERFYDLLVQLNTLDGIERIRISSIEPDLLSDEIIEMFAHSKKFLPHFHIPLQSGNDKILKLMHRRYDTQLFKKKTEKIFSLMPHACIAVDIIVGFPGETEADFLETLKVIELCKFDSAFTFLYSIRTGTPAATMDEQIPDAIKHDRINRCLEVLHQISHDINQTYLDQIVEVLVEETSRNNPERLAGRTRTSKLVNFPGEPADIGKQVMVKITATKTFSLDGEKIEQEDTHGAVNTHDDPIPANS